jgi:hypothetical protein
MYLNPQTTEINLDTVTLTPRHAAGIRRALDSAAKNRFSTYVKEPTARRFQARIKQVSRYLAATAGPHFSAQLSASKRQASWVYVTPTKTHGYALSKISFKKTRFGAEPTVNELPIAITAHCIDRLIQQSTIQEVALPRLMFDLMELARNCLSIEDEFVGACTEWPKYGSAYLGNERGLFVCVFPPIGSLVCKTFISKNRLIEKRAIWEAMLSSGSQVRFIESFAAVSANDAE